MAKDENMSVVQIAREELEKNQNTAITPTGTDQIPDKAKVLQINKDKLKAVKSSFVKEIFDELVEIQQERDSLNDRSNELFSRFPKVGIPRKAARMAFVRFTTDEHKLAELDAAFIKCIESVNVGFQSDLFNFSATDTDNDYDNDTE